MRRSRSLALAVALAVPTVLIPQSTRAQEIEPATRPVAATQPSAPATAPATRPVNDGPKGIIVQPGGGLLLNFKDASIDSVLDELSAVAGFIVVKEVKPEGRVTLISKQPVRAADAIPLLNTVLRNAGYAAIQQERILKIVPRDRAKRLNIPVRVGSNPADIESTDELITQVIPLRYADAPQLRQDLQPMINSEADFTANASSNALVITDTSANIRRIVEIVAALDTHLADAVEVKVFQLQYTTASTAAQLINTLFNDPTQQGARGGVGGAGATPFGGRFGGAGGFPGGGFAGGGGFPGGGGFGGRGGDGGRGGAGGGAQSGRRSTRVAAAADDRTNSLVVTGPTDTLKVVAEVIKEIDSNPAANETVFVYRLKNGQAYNLEAVLNNLLNGTNMSRGSTGGTGNVRNATNRGTSTGARGGTGGTSSRTGGLGGTGGFGSTGGFGAGGFAAAGGITGRGGIGGLGVSASTARLAAGMAGEVTIIADPDTNSLLIRTKPNNIEMVKMILADLDRPVAQVLIKVLIAEVTHDKGSDIGAEFSILNMRPSGLGQQGGTNFLGPAANLGGGLVAQILEQDFTATIRALETAGKLDVLSRPYILASDNQLASITVGQEVPFITRSQLTEQNTTINTIEYSDIGILLDVIPHINPDGLVILDVAPEISALTGSSVPISETVSAPIFAKRSAQSRVAIRNGQTVVIGGLMEDRRTETINKVPLVGDIPLLGEAFKRREKKNTKTELLIFLTPHVAAQPDALQGMSQTEMEGSKLVPQAVDPNAFKEHMEGMQRGATTQPSAPGTGK